MNEVRLEIYVDGNGNCTMHSGAASNGEIINTLVNVLAVACDTAATDQEATDKKALLAAVCAGLMDPPEYTCEDYGKQEG